MKKLIVIGFFSLFALQFAGLYGYFGVRLMAIRKEMKALLKILPESDLERIVLSTKEFRSIDIEEGEIEQNGKMYDIARIKKQGDNYILFALHDAHEDNLLSLLDEIIKRSGNDKKPVPSQLLQFFSLIFITTSNHFNLSCSESIFYFTEHIDFYQSAEKILPLVPPWA